MAQQARERQAMTVAPRYTKPAIFGGTDASWRTLCDLYPSAETTELIMAVVEYCAVRRLDPFKRPCHIVPMWNAKLKRRVQVVMQGINEVEITASRTGAWAGMDLPQWGPAVERTFRGTIDNDDGSKRAVEITMTYPTSCAVTVWRLVGGERRAFTEQLFFEECYARAGFRTEVPNDRWSKAPRQMLHKCTKAATLRAAFPEEGLGYTAEEMEDHETDTGGVTIEGTIDHGDPGMTERDRKVVEQPPPPPPSGDALEGFAPLMEGNGTLWLRNLSALLMAATTEARVAAIERHERVVASLATAPTLIRDQITRMISTARERVRKVAEQPPPPDWPAPPGFDSGAPPGFDPGGGNPPGVEGWPDDPILELLAEVEAMDLIALDALATSAEWRAKTRAAIDFPPDQDRLNEAIATRRAILKGSKST
jgi:phage recombination protein Bet